MNQKKEESECGTLSMASQNPLIAAPMIHKESPTMDENTKTNVYLDEADHCSGLYSHNPPLPTKTADRTEGWADSLEPLSQTNKQTNKKKEKKNDFMNVEWLHCNLLKKLKLRR